MSNRIMLITFTGRRSGRQYTTPVSYMRDGDILTILSRRDRTSWKNLRGRVPVTVQVKGENLQGFGELVAADRESIAVALQAFRKRLSPAKAAQRAQERVLVRIRLPHSSA